MKVAIARLRSMVRYEQPLHHIMDSFYELLRGYVQHHPEHEWRYYGFAFWPDQPVYDPAAIEAADVVLIPSEAEFTYFVPGLLHTLSVKRSVERVQALGPAIANKRVVVLRSDRSDDAQLFHEYTWPGVPFQHREIDEFDLAPSVHGLKFFAIRQARGIRADETAWQLGRKKQHDFGYWGTDRRRAVGGGKSGDQRHVVLRAIDRTADLDCLFVGAIKGMQHYYHTRFRPMEELLTPLETVRTTLCFNWLGKSTITARYLEAIGCGILPLTWQDYDADGILGTENWQRVTTAEEAIHKIRWLGAEKARGVERFRQAEKALLARLPTPDAYAARFDDLLTAALQS
jgi:hypothetical protein